jgi:hypothetical protein
MTVFFAAGAPENAHREHGNDQRNNEKRGRNVHGEAPYA